jgi:methyltransferase (TIGR00027 family)
MKEGRSSLTARWMAACRALGALIPAESRLAHDPYAARFCGPAMKVALSAGGSARAARLVLRPIQPWVAYVQVRTRAIDDALVEFAGAGGRQVVILGAGFDCRAARFADALGDARVYEIDHPATQARKRAAMAGVRQPPLAYVPWDFEARPMSELPGALAARGLDAAARTLVLWEGVTMYLSAPAVEETLAAVRRLGAPGSPLVFTYFEKKRIQRPDSAALRAVAGVMARFVGEPFRFGWDPAELSGWLAARGFVLERDRTEAELATLLAPAWRSYVRPFGDHVALARTAA